MLLHKCDSWLSSDLPQELIRDVSGQVAFEEESPRVKPVEAFGDAEKGIKEASTRLVFDHLNSFSDQKVLRQRHQVSLWNQLKLETFFQRN